MQTPARPPRLTFKTLFKDRYVNRSSEWEERQKTRQLEMEACSKALAVLSSDDAHDLLPNLLNHGNPNLLNQVNYLVFIIHYWFKMAY